MTRVFFIITLLLFPFYLNSKPLFVGDSLTYQLAVGYRNYSPVDALYLEGSGLHSSKLIDWREYIEDIDFSRYDSVFIVLGTNDLILNSQVSDYENKVNDFLRKVKRNNNFVFWLLPPALRDTKKNSLLNNARRVITQVAEKEGVTVIDMRLYLGAEYTEKNNGISIRTKDGIHITPAGAELIVKNLIK